MLRVLISKLIPLAILALLLTGCATTSNAPRGNTQTLEGLCSLSAGTNTCNTGVSAIRQESLQEAAMSLGAQAGLAYRAKQINCTLLQHSKELDQVFNFSLMMLPHSVIPPVLVEGRQTLNLADCQTIRIADRTYKIICQAHFATTPPTWRTYLWLNYPCPDQFTGGLLPRNNEERKIWCCAAAEGWKQGIIQAEQIYATNLARLKRDFTGMIRYRELLAQHMVSPPYVARTELGVTGSCSDLRINDQVLRITALPCLQVDSRNWKAIVDESCP